MLTRLFKISIDESLLVRGPASIRAKSLGISSLGKNFEEDERRFIRKNKVLPFETSLNEAYLLVTLGSGGDFKLTRGGFGTKIWRNVAEKVFSDENVKYRKIVVVGETDSGKSTMTVYLLNRALSKGLKVGVLDGDIGQADITPPGSVGATIVKNQVLDLRDLRAEFFGFIGATSPYHLGDLVVSEIVRAQSYLEEKNVDFYVVNTDGYVRNGGVTHKMALLHAIEPELVVCIRGVEDSFCSELKNALSNLAILVADRSERIAKNSIERGERRVSQYQRFLRGSKVVNVNLHVLKICFMGIHYDRQTLLSPYQDSQILIFRKDGDSKIFRIVFGREPLIRLYMSEKVVELTLSSLRGMFIGLGLEGSVTGYGHISRVNPNLDLRILTSASSPFDTIFLSSIRLSQSLTEEYTTPIVTNS